MDLLKIPLPLFVNSDTQNCYELELQIFEPNGRLLTNRDLPDLTREFFNKEGLSLALSPGIPISLERG